MPDTLHDFSIINTEREREREKVCAHAHVHVYSGEWGGGGTRQSASSAQPLSSPNHGQQRRFQSSARWVQSTVRNFVLSVRILSCRPHWSEHKISHLLTFERHKTSWNFVKIWQSGSYSSNFWNSWAGVPKLIGQGTLSARNRKVDNVTDSPWLKWQFEPNIITRKNCDQYICYILHCYRTDFKLTWRIWSSACDTDKRDGPG